MRSLLDSPQTENAYLSYQSITYFWVESLERIAKRYELNHAEIDVVARSLGNYTFTQSFNDNAKAFDYVRFTVGESKALKKFSRWSLANSKSELSYSEYLICQRLLSKGILTLIEFESEEYYELSQSVIDWLRYTTWETMSLH
jgi:hypothetical protein